MSTHTYIHIGYTVSLKFLRFLFSFGFVLMIFDTIACT